MNFTKTRLFKFTVILLFIILSVYALSKAAGVLKPIAVSLILALLLLPVARFFEKYVSRGLSSGISTALIFLAIAAVTGLISYQGVRMSENWEKLKTKADRRIDKVEQVFIDKTGITKKEVKKLVKDSGIPKIKGLAESLLSKSINSVLDILLMLIYTFLLLNYRNHFKTFLLKILKKSDEKTAENTLEDAAVAVQGYLKAKFIMIAILAVIYAIGLSLMGVKFGIFYGILAALLSLIPFIGNVIGAGFPILSAVIYNDTTTVMLVIVLFVVVQFVESYVIQPLLIKKEVDLHPFFSIACAVIGGTIWGVTGMIIAIPFLAIFYIIFSNVEKLSPYAYLLSEDEQ